MRDKILLLMICFLVGLTPHAHARKGQNLFDDLKSRLHEVENPFKPTLPKKEEPEPEDIEPVRPSTRPAAEPTTGKPVTVTPVTPAPVVKETPLPNITISGIVWDSDRPQAIINGKVVDIGDTISEIQITNIQKARVDGLFYGKHVTINPKGVRYE